MHVVLDCANGAASKIGPSFLDRLGARVTVLAASPDGTNINRDCGATSPQNLVDRVLAEGADAGLALDGDADRAILVDERGRLLDGDDILLAWARHLKAHDRLPGNRVVATVMSNFGLERSLPQRRHDHETLPGGRPRRLARHDRRRCRPRRRAVGPHHLLALLGVR